MAWDDVLGRIYNAAGRALDGDRDGSCRDDIYKAIGTVAPAMAGAGIGYSLGGPFGGGIGGSVGGFLGNSVVSPFLEEIGDFQADAQGERSLPFPEESADLHYKNGHQGIGQQLHDAPPSALKAMAMGALGETSTALLTPFGLPAMALGGVSGLVNHWIE